MQPEGEGDDDGGLLMPRDGDSDLQPHTHICRLPEELFLAVLSLLDYKDLISLSITCKYFARMTEEDSLWRAIYKGISVQEVPSVLLQTNTWKDLFISAKTADWGRQSVQPTFYARRQPASGVECIAISEKGDMIVAGSIRGKVRFFDTQSAQLLHQITAHIGTVSCLDLKGNLLVTGSWDTTLKMWDCTELPPRQLYHFMREGEIGYIRCIKLWLPSSLIASGSNDNTIKLWDTNTGQNANILKGHSGAVTCLQFRNEGNELMTGSWDCTVKLWDLRLGAAVMTMRAQAPPPPAVIRPPSRLRNSSSSSPNNDHNDHNNYNNTFLSPSIPPAWLSIGRDDYRNRNTAVNIYNTITTNTIDHSGDGISIAPTSTPSNSNSSGSAQTTTTTPINARGTDKVTCLEIADDDPNVVYVGREDHIVCSFELRAGKPHDFLLGHRGWVQSLSSFDGYLASGSADGSILLWSARETRCVNRIHATTSSVQAVKMTATYLYAGGADSSISRWDFSGPLRHSKLKHQPAEE